MRLITVLVFCVAMIGCSGSSTPAPQPAKPAAAPKPPDGRREISAAREAFRKVTQFSLETSSVTPLGEFTQLTQVDCAAPYYYDKHTKDWSAEGIQSNTTLTQGRPKAHQEDERLFVDGASYYRGSGAWENPAKGSDDWEPGWRKSLNSWDPTKECDSYRQQPNGIPFLPFEKILAQKITYEDTLGEGDERCHQFKVTYPDFAYSDTMKTIPTPGGSTSYREEVTKPMESLICIGVADHLPWTIEKDGKTYTLSYEDFSRLRMPTF